MWVTQVFFSFTPKIGEHIFQMGLVQPPTSLTWKLQITHEKKGK